MKKLELQNNFELKKLETESKTSHADSESKFDVTKLIRLVTPFQEKDVDQYFLHFEKIAKSLKWPKEYWCLLLQSVFVGKAREIYSQLSVVQASDYDYVKELILKGYELVPEAYRQRFRNCQKESNQTYVEFARKKEQLFDRWCNSKKVNQNHENLRDTGASQSLLLVNTLPFSDVSFTGTNVLIKGVDSTEFTSIPLHNAYLSSDLVSGHVVVGILPSLQFDGVHLLLGNDLAGSKVDVNPLVTDKPSVDPNTDSIEQEIPGLFPSCAVTRSLTQSKSTSDDVTTDVDLADTFLSRVINDDKISDVTNDDFSAKAQMFSRSDLIREQNSDPDVSCLFARSVDECDVSRDPVCCYTKNDVLMRKWRSSDVPADDEWAVKHQIVVPSSYRPHILSLAHDTPMSGHLGINKTYQRILEHFYWPNLRKDVVEFRRSCHTCQVVGKPNQTLPKAPLQPIPAFEKPFSRVIIDCVGPLPKTKSGNQYLLTVMCASTRFPQAIPLRNISAKTIVKALIKFFTLVVFIE